MSVLPMHRRTRDAQKPQLSQLSRRPAAHALSRPTALAAILSVLFSSSIRAATVEYTSTSDPNLSTPANWQGGTLPGSTDTASLGQGVPSALVLQNSTLTLQGLTYTPTTTAGSITLSTYGSGTTSLTLGSLSNQAITQEVINVSSANASLNISGPTASVSGNVKLTTNGLFSGINFLAGASAGGSLISNGPNGTTTFNASSGGHSVIAATGNQSAVIFTNGSTAATSVITVGTSSIVGFADSSSAGSSTLTNLGLATFAGASTAGTSTVSNSGTLSIANGASLASAMLTNLADVEFTGTASAGTASITSTGTLAFHDQTDAGSSVIANSATLSFADTSNAGSSTITNAKTGSITFSGMADASAAKVISAGTIDISSMQQSLSIGSLTGSGSVTLGANNLTLGALGSADVFSGAISGAGGLNKVGAGQLTMTGVNQYTGATSINSGTLELDGSLTSSVAVMNQAFLTGTGSTSSNVQVLGGGTLQPLSTLHVGGNLMLAPQSQFIVSVDPSGANSSVLVGGTATITGSNLSVQASGASTSYAPSKTYTVLSATQGVSGTFAQVAVNLPLLAPAVHYDPNDVTLSFTQLPVSGGGAGSGINGMMGGSNGSQGSGSMSASTGSTTGSGSNSGSSSGGTSGPSGTSGTSGSGNTGSSGTGSNSGTGSSSSMSGASSGNGSSGSGTSGSSTSGNATGASGNGSAALIGSLDNLNAGSLGTALSSLGAASYGAMRRIELEDADDFPRKVAEHQFASRTLDGDQGPGWVELQAQRASDSDTFGGTSWDQSGLIGGVDVVRGESSMVSLSAQYLRGSADLGNGSTGTTTRYDIGVDGTLTKGDLILEGTVSYGRHSDDVHRYIAFDNYREGPNANSGGDDFTGRGEIATRLSWRKVTFMPYASVQWTMANQDSFQEGGGAATDLYGDARRENIVTTSLGVRARYQGLLASDWIGGLSTSSISGGLAWIHQSGCLDGQVQASFLEDPSHTPFISTAGAIGADRAAANIALNTTWPSGWHAQLRLAGEAGHAIRSAEAFAGVGYDF